MAEEITNPSEELISPIEETASPSDEMTGGGSVATETKPSASKVDMLWNALSKDDVYKNKVGSIDEFRTKMQNPEKAKMLWNALSKDEVYASKVGDEKTFLSKVSSPKPPAPSTKGGESGAVKTPSTSTSVLEDLESGSWTKTINPLADKGAVKPTQQAQQAGVAKKPNQVESGNIDLSNRPVVDYGGKKATVLSFSIGTDKGEVLIPQVVNGKVVSKDEAIKHYEKTGEHLGIFKTIEDANRYGQELHQQEEKRVASLTKKDKGVVIPENYTPTLQENIAKIEGMTMRAKFPEYANIQKGAFDFKQASAEAISKEEQAQKEQTLKRKEERRVQNLPNEIEALRKERADLLLDKSPEAKKKIAANEAVTKKMQQELNSLNNSKYESLQNLNQRAIKDIDLEVNEYLEEDPKLKDKIKAVGLTETETWDLAQKAIAKKIAPLEADLQMFKSEGTVDAASAKINLANSLRNKQEKMTAIAGQMRSYETDYLNKTGFSGLNKELETTKKKLDSYEPYLKRANSEVKLHEKELTDLKIKLDSFSSLIKDNTFLGTAAQFEELKAIEKEYNNTIQDLNNVYKNESLLGYEDAVNNYNSLIAKKNNLVSGLKSTEYQKMANDLDALKLDYDMSYEDYSKYEDPKVKDRINQYFSTIQKIGEYDEKLKTTKGELSYIGELEKAQEKFNNTGVGGDFLDIGARAVNSILDASKKLVASPFRLAASFSDLAGKGSGTYHYSDWVADLIEGTGYEPLFLTKKTNNLYDAKSDKINLGFSPILGAVADQTGIILTLALTGKYSNPVVQRAMTTAGMDLTAMAEVSESAKIATTIAPAFMISYGDNYKEALSKGFSVEGAMAYSGGLSLLEGLTETMLPDQDLVFGKDVKNQLLNRFIKDYSKGKKYAIKNLAQNFLYNAGSEITEENIAALGKTIATSIGNLTSDDIEVEIPTINQTVTTAITSGLSGGGMGLFGSVSEQSQMYKLGVMNLANDFKTGKELLDKFKEKGKITDERYNKLISDAQKFQSVRGQIPNGLSGYKVMAIAEKMIAIRALSADMNDDKNNPINKINQKKINKIQDEVEAIIDDENFDKRAEYELNLEAENLNKQQQEKPATAEGEVVLTKNTSPTSDKYGTINRNDGKGVVDLTKEEFEAEQAKMQPKVDEQVAPTAEGEQADKATTEFAETKFTPIPNPTVVITGLRNGFETLSSNNPPQEKPKDIGRGRSKDFDKDGILIDTDSEGNKTLYVKVDAADAFGRAGNITVQIKVPNGSEVNQVAIKKIIDEQVEKMKSNNNIDLRLDKISQSDFDGLKNAIVEEVEKPTIITNEKEPTKKEDGKPIVAEGEQAPKTKEEIVAEIERLKKEKEKEIDKETPIKNENITVDFGGGVSVKYQVITYKDGSVKISTSGEKAKRYSELSNEAFKDYAKIDFEPDAKSIIKTEVIKDDYTDKQSQEIKAAKEKTINEKYDSQITELEQQYEKEPTKKEDGEPMSRGVQGVRTEGQAGKESAELRTEEEEVADQAGSVVGGEVSLNKERERLKTKLEKLEYQDPSTNVIVRLNSDGTFKDVGIYNEKGVWNSISNNGEQAIKNAQTESYPRVKKLYDIDVKLNEVLNSKLANDLVYLKEKLGGLKQLEQAFEGLPYEQVGSISYISKSIDEFLKRGLQSNKLDGISKAVESLLSKEQSTPKKGSVVGGEVVKDNKGQPLTLFHGTGKEFTDFDIEKTSGVTRYGKGVSFTDAKGIAIRYSLERQGLEDSQENDSKAIVKEANVSIKAPFDDRGKIDKDTPQAKKLIQILTERFGLNIGLVNNILDANIQSRNSAFQNISEAIFDKSTDKKTFMFKGDTEKTRAILEEAGYDSIIGEYEDATEYFIFNPKNILSKSLQSTPTTEEKVSGGLTQEEKINLENISKDAGVNFQEVRNVYNKYGEGKPLNEITLEDYQKAEEKRQEQKSTKTTEDAVQKQAAGQVPIQPKAGVSEEVEGGKPEAKSEKATKESQKEIDELFDLYESIDELKGLDKRKAADDFRNMQQSIKNPTLKRIFDNISDIHSQLEKQGLITKTKGCP